MARRTELLALSVRQLKNIVKSFIAFAVPKLPIPVRIAVANSFGTESYDIFKVLARRFNIVSINVAGDYGIFQGDPSDAIIVNTYARTGTWAANTNLLLKGFFDKSGGGTYIDVGANIGLTTIPVARNRTVRCHAVEADPMNYANLARNVALNCEYGNVAIYEAAAFSQEAELQFERSNFNFGDHRIRLGTGGKSEEEQSRVTITVHGRPLDTIIPAVVGPLAVKIDTQGAEPFVIAGGGNVLANCELLIMEFWPYGMKNLEADPEVVLSFIETHFSSMIVLSPLEMPAIPQMPVSQAVLELRRLFAEKISDADWHVDIIARRASASERT
jgi:FkbM family methyltransferase